MKLAGVRVLALAVALMLVFACLADIAHAADGDADACPQGKLERPRPPAVFVDSALLPDRVEPGGPALLGRIVHADRSVSAPSVFVRRSAPRAPPTA